MRFTTRLLLALALGSMPVLTGTGVATAAPLSAGTAADDRAVDAGTPAVRSISEIAKVTDPNSASSAWFGTEVAIDGSTAVVADGYGADNRGTVLVYTRSGSTWSLEATLRPNRATRSDDAFGVSLAIDGDTILVGAYLDDVDGAFDQGSVHVFTRSGTAWSEQAVLTAAEGETGDGFGESVALDGDTAVIGAEGGGAEFYQGAAYVFTRSGTTWSQQAELTAADGLEQDQFGASVTVDGDLVAVGAVGDDVGGASNQGSVYVFSRTGSAWSQQTQLTAEAGLGRVVFGRVVALSGDTLAVSGQIAGSGDGVVAVYVRAGAGWSQQAELMAEPPSIDFAEEMDLDGDTIVASSESYAQVDRVLVYTRSRGTWSYTGELVGSDAEPLDSFGSSVALDGNSAVVGALAADDGAGAAYLFSRAG